jgi:phosphatidylserine/phosphatidylglycerophosphate/cardiolipin synthase-like enzyme
MKFKIILPLFLLFATSVAWGQIAAWNLTSSTTSATAADANLNAGSIAVVPSTSLIAYQASPGDVYCGSWSTSTTFSTTGKYWEFSIAPNPGFEMTTSSLTFKAGRTSTGPQLLQVQYSLDGFATAGTTALGETANANTSALTQFTLTALPPVTSSTVTFRIWGYGASGTGNFRLNNIVVNGTVVSTSVQGSGIGAAQILPTSLNAAQTSDFSIKVASNETDTIANIVVVVPQAFSWSMNSSGVSLVGNSLSSASVSVNMDTINITGAAVTKSDTGQIVVHSVTVPDSSVTGIFIVKTSVDTVLPSTVNSKLAVSVIKVVRIADLHINDSQGVPIAPYQIGAAVTVRGIVTADFSALPQTNIFLQDATGGVNIFSYTHSYDYQLGDSITFTGTIQQFRGTVEIMPDSAKTIIHSHNNSFPQPLLLTCADVNQTFNDDFTEPNEGRLVRVNGVTYNAANATITDITGTTGGYVPTNLVSPTGTFDVIGILKQYKPGTTSMMAPPYTSDYEVEARIQSDIISSPGPAFVERPTEENIGPNSVKIYFKTDSRASRAVVRYGANSDYKDSVVVTTPDTVYEIALSSLLPATVYHYQVAAADQAGINTTGDAIFGTASPAGTTGIMNVYFNHAVSADIAHYDTAKTVNILDKFLARIDSAKYSIDLALYSLSGTPGVGSTIASHLLSAKSRGVKIRMIAEDGNSNTSPMTTMKSNVPFITGAFDPNRKNGLMHNKFGVFDFRDASSFTDDWVWMGSWNATDPGNNNDAQNAIEIQDKALASAYTMEFNEMWGSSTDAPNAAQSLFGSDKKDITPHKFNINGTPVELYFSPSDQTTLHIYETLASATNSINICMLTFTRSDLAQELVTKKAAGDKVRVLIDNNTDNGNQYSFLQTSGIDVHLKGSDVSGFLHHKYAVIDAENPKANGIVITGSHNWSKAAESDNDENTLIIHSNRIANLYLQEFKARYVGAGGSDNIVLGVKRVGDDVPKSFGLNQNYPNPFNPSTVISYQLSVISHVTMKVYDVLGREVTTLVDQRQSAGYYNVTFDASRFTSGVYFCRLIADGNGSEKFVSVKKLVLMK